VTDPPADPVSTLLETAIVMHTLFLAYQEAGFSEAQAFTLVQTTISAQSAPPAGQS
jgi:hypothetical protein